MLAIKLHRERRVNLAKGCHVIPVIRWGGATEVQIRNWIRLLETTKSTPYPTNAVHFMSQLRIPDHFPVRLLFEYQVDKEKVLTFWPETFQPLKNVPQSQKQALQEWWEAFDNQPGGLRVQFPEMVLGEALPLKNNLLWTKDIRVKRRNTRKPELRRVRKRKLDHEE
jgi:hypothetical protein